MKEINFKKSTPKGLVSGILRIINKDLFFKYNDTNYSKQIIKNFRDKGVDIEEGKGWIKVNLLGKNEVIKLGEIEIDKEEPNETIEKKLFDFYLNQYKIMGFLVQEKDEESN